jgi:RecJ-like exonuclease
MRDLCMASCDNEFEQAIAKAQGWRTFRVMRQGDRMLPREIVCPASKEAGAKTTCALCKACGGNGAKAKADIAIVAHGAAGKVNAFNQRAAA